VEENSAFSHCIFKNLLLLAHFTVVVCDGIFCKSKVSNVLTQRKWYEEQSDSVKFYWLITHAPCVISTKRYVKKCMQFNLIVAKIRQRCAISKVINWSIENSQRHGRYTPHQWKSQVRGFLHGGVHTHLIRAPYTSFKTFHCFIYDFSRCHRPEDFDSNSRVLRVAL